MPNTAHTFNLARYVSAGIASVRPSRGYDCASVAVQHALGHGGLWPLPSTPTFLRHVASRQFYHRGSAHARRFASRAHLSPQHRAYRETARTLTQRDGTLITRISDTSDVERALIVAAIRDKTSISRRPDDSDADAHAHAHARAPLAARGAFERRRRRALAALARARAWLR